MMKSYTIIKVAQLCLLFLLIFLWLPTVTLAAENGQDSVYIIDVDGEITPAMASFLDQKITEANGADARGILINIKTLGGRVDSAIIIRDAMLASRVPVAVYIESRAISAGALISIAAEKIVMAPGSHMGAAEPIPSDPKIVAFVSGEFRTTAERRGRDPQIAMAMVDQSIVIEGLVGEGEILDLTASEASANGYADYLANGIDEAMKALEWDQADRVEIKMGFRNRIAQFLTSAEIASILLTIAVLAMIAEFYAPGFGVPGVISILCFVLYFAGGFIAGYTELWAIAVFLIGIVLIIIEVIVPGFGIFGISGIAAIIVSVILASPTVRQGLLSLAIALVAAVLAIPLFIKLFGRSRLIQRLVLSHAETTDQGYVHTIVKLDLTGKSGIAVTDLRPAGLIVIDGARTDAITMGDYIDKGAPVRVVRMEGTKVIVAADQP